MSTLYILIFVKKYMTEEEADIKLVHHDLLLKVSCIGKEDGGQET